MANVTGSGVIGGVNQTAVNNFSDSGFWFEWIEFTNNPANLTQAGFNTANGTLATGTVVYNAGATNNLNNLASDASAAVLGNSGEQFGLRVVTTINITTAGSYTFTLTSDDGAIVYVDGTPAVSDDSLHAPRTVSGAPRNLTAGLHDITIIYFENTGRNVLGVSLTGPDYPTSTLLQNAAVRANAGNDTINAADGNDIIDAGAGNDTINGEGGNDSILGGAGNDSLTGGAGLDSIFGGDGNDTIDGGADNDSLGGGAGNDSIIGGAGNDSITGDAGLDTIFGGDGNDTIDGGADNDSIDGGIGNDSILGGLGADSITGGAGLDTIFGGDGNDTIDGGDDNDNVTGGLGNDSLIGGLGADNLNGGDGNDILVGGAGNDTFADGLGDDLIFGGAGDDLVVTGAAGNDTMFGGEGNDTLGGDIGNDSLDGGDGNDVLEGHDGADFIEGGAGNDYIAGFDVSGITAQGPTGNLNPPVGNDDNANDTLFGGTGNDTILGGGGADSLDGGAADDIIFGGTGTDSIQGGTGNDFIDAGAGNDTVDAGTGADTIRASSGTDSIQGGDGQDTYVVPSGSPLVPATSPDSTLGITTETITVTVDENGDGTVVKTVNATTDTIGSVENFIADEAVAENDRLIYTTVVTDEGTITGLNGATGTFTDKNGNVVTFGGVGQPTFNDVLIQNRTGDFIANGGSLTGTVGNIGFTDFETVTFSVVCFAKGTRIKTKKGEMPIEALAVGDQVWTKDHGHQSLRWIGSKTVPATDALAPVRIRAHTMGNKRDLIVSQQHRMLVRGLRVEMLFGVREALVPAVHLVNGTSITICEDGFVTYFHMLFDEHQIVDAEGALSESLHPGQQALSTLDQAARDEVVMLFPELGDRAAPERRMARTPLRRFETEALLALAGLEPSNQGVRGAPKRRTKAMAPVSRGSK
ncbi:MAG: Hint domain-containing protein [Paracoccaceae bacterium]|nr:Hint domain-containing protein [Paracoccaceae bacterium]